MTRLAMLLDENLSLLGQADALGRVGKISSVYNVQKSVGAEYSIFLSDPASDASVIEEAQKVNCVRLVERPIERFYPGLSLNESCTLDPL